MNLAEHVGKRLLVIDRRYVEAPINEIVVLALSPSKKYAKIEWVNGDVIRTSWERTISELSVVEELVYPDAGKATAVDDVRKLLPIGLVHNG